MTVLILLMPVLLNAPMTQQQEARAHHGVVILTVLILLMPVLLNVVVQVVTEVMVVV